MAKTLDYTNLIKQLNSMVSEKDSLKDLSSLNETQLKIYRQYALKREKIDKQV